MALKINILMQKIQEICHIPPIPQGSLYLDAKKKLKANYTKQKTQMRNYEIGN